MTPYKKYEAAIKTITNMNTKDWTDEEFNAIAVAVDSLERAMAECADLEKEFTIGRELDNLRPGKQLRDYCKQHKAELKRYHFKISLFEKYPYLPVILSIVAVSVAFTGLLLRICL